MKKIIALTILLCLSLQAKTETDIVLAEQWRQKFQDFHPGMIHSVDISLDSGKHLFHLTSKGVLMMKGKDCSIHEREIARLILKMLEAWPSPVFLYLDTEGKPFIGYRKGKFYCHD